MDIDTSYNFLRINEKLTTSGLIPTDGLKALASQDYAVVINLLPDTSEYAIPHEREIVESQGIEYIYIPVDFQHPEPSDFSAFSESLERVLNSKVHIHCAANYRVSAFYALFEVNHGRWSQEQAMAFIQSIWQPIEHPEWSQFITDTLNRGSNQRSRDHAGPAL